MSETAYALVDNRLPDSSEVNDNSRAPRTPDQLLREGHAQLVEIALKQAQGTRLRDTEVAETLVEGHLRSTGFGSNIASVVDLPDFVQVSQAPPQVSFYALQEWEGYVLEAGEEEFTARLLDLTADSLQEAEEAAIPLAEISEDDRRRLRPGSIFRWVIGYERSRSGTKRRVSQIVFRDLPAMTRHDRSEGEEWARKIAQSMVD